MNSIVVLGASGWIGHRLLVAANELSSDSQIAGSYNARLPKVGLRTFQAASSSWSIFEHHLNELQATHVFNTLRGEDESGFELHQKLIEFCNNHAAHYSYASSFNAVDAKVDAPHPESEPANAQTDYGKFKARCEHELLRHGTHFAVFRFPAVHGWAPHRESRTESFLKRLASGQTMRQPRGIVQNRIADTLLARMMVCIALCRGQGVFHLGSVDHSDEVDFLRRLASKFGYSASQVSEDGEEPCNAVMMPLKVFELCGDEYRYMEQDTLDVVASDPNLQKYRKL